MTVQVYSEPLYNGSPNLAVLEIVPGGSLQQEIQSELVCKQLKSREHPTVRR